MNSRVNTKKSDIMHIALKLLKTKGKEHPKNIQRGKDIFRIARADSLEKTLMLEKIDSRRRKGRQRIRWLGSITTQRT